MAQSQLPLPRFVQAIPTNGDLIHAKGAHSDRPSWMYPERHVSDPTSEVGRLLTGNSICGVRGRDSTGWGGMAAVLDDAGDLVDFDTENVPPPKESWNGGTINVVCPRCLSLVRRLRAAHAKRVKA